MDIGSKIEELRKERNWSQSDLAAALEESRQEVARWEKGSSLPELDRLIHMSILFEIPLRDLMGDQVKNYDLDFQTDQKKEAEKKRKDRRLRRIKGILVGIVILLAILINMVWIRFLFRFF